MSASAEYVFKQVLQLGVVAVGLTSGSLHLIGDDFQARPCDWTLMAIIVILTVQALLTLRSTSRNILRVGMVCIGVVLFALAVTGLTGASSMGSAAAMLTFAVLYFAVWATDMAPDSVRHRVRMHVHHAAKVMGSASASRTSPPPPPPLPRRTVRAAVDHRRSSAGRLPAMI
jgi:hypothetical protein